MNAHLPEQKKVIIAGDVTIDWNLIFFQSTQDTTSLWDASNTARACPQPGGVAMLSGLMETLLADLNSTIPTKIYTYQLARTFR